MKSLQEKGFIILAFSKCKKLHVGHQLLQYVFTGFQLNLCVALVGNHEDVDCFCIDFKYD